MQWRRTFILPHQFQQCSHLQPAHSYGTNPFVLILTFSAYRIHKNTGRQSGAISLSCGPQPPMCWFLTADFRAPAATGDAGRHPPPTLLPCVLPIAPVNFSTVGALWKWCSVMEGDYLREHHLLLLEPTSFRSTVHTSCCLWSQRYNLIFASLLLYLRNLLPRCAWRLRMHQICSTVICFPYGNHSIVLMHPSYKQLCSARGQNSFFMSCYKGYGNSQFSLFLHSENLLRGTQKQSCRYCVGVIPVWLMKYHKPWEKPYLTQISWSTLTVWSCLQETSQGPYSQM